MKKLTRELIEKYFPDAHIEDRLFGGWRVHTNGGERGVSYGQLSGCAEDEDAAACHDKRHRLHNGE